MGDHLPDWMFQNSFHMAPSIQWYVEVPSSVLWRQSPVFVLQGVKVIFEFDKGWRTGHLLRLKSKSDATVRLARPFSVTVFADLVGDDAGKFKIRSVNVYSLPIEIWNADHSTVLGRPSLIQTSNPKLQLMRFIISFGKDSGLAMQPEPTRKHGLTEDDSTLLLNNLENLSVDFGKMLETSAHTDVQIECNGGVVSAHRAVLASRSEVFDRMFQADMQESRTGIIKMIDAEVEAVKEFLQFIYSGKIGNPSVGMVYCLYRLADKYDVSTLKDLCSDLMTKHVCKKSRK